MTKRMWKFRTQWPMALRLNKKCLQFFFFTFHSPTGFDKSPTNVDIRGKSVLIHTSDNRAVWIIKDVIWGYRRCVADTREIFGMLNIWSCRRFTILLCERVPTEKYISDDLQPMREQATGQREAQEDFNHLTINHLQTTCIHFGIRNIQIR